MPQCPGCGRSVGAAGGGLDLLDDATREAADRFAVRYSALRRQEGWVGAGGREDPEGGDQRLWGERRRSVSEAAAALEGVRTGAEPPVVIDVGSGGGWAARYLRDADVIAIDLIDSPAHPNVLHVRGDMRCLPLRDGTIDGALYAASLHYAPIEDSIREAARVLKPHGVLVAVDSPMYRDRHAQASSEARAAAYYARAGFPELAASYHPIDVMSLRAALAGSGFEVLRLEAGRSARRWRERLRPHRRRSILVARLPPPA